MDTVAPVEIESTDKYLIYHIGGTFDATAVKAVRDQLEAQIDAVQDIHVMDMTEAVFVDSSGIGAIVFLYKRLAAKNKRFVMIGLSGQPADLIKMLRIDKVINIKGSLADIA